MLPPLPLCRRISCHPSPSLKSSSSLFSFVSRLSFPLQNAVAMRNRPSQKYHFFTFRFIRAQGLPRCKVLAVPACRRMSALPPPPRPAASLPPSQPPKKYLCGWSPACGVMLRLPGSELHMGLLEKGMEERGRDAESLGKGPAGTGTAGDVGGGFGTWPLAAASLQGQGWAVWSSRDGREGSKRREKGAERGEANSSNASEGTQHETRVADARGGKSVLFLYYTSPRHGKAAASPGRPWRAASGETFRDVVQRGNDFNAGQRFPSAHEPSRCPWCTPTPSLRSPRRRRGEGGCFLGSPPMSSRDVQAFDTLQ